jgi:hypothetical protein
MPAEDCVSPGFDLDADLDDGPARETAGPADHFNPVQFAGVVGSPGPHPYASKFKRRGGAER